MPTGLTRHYTTGKIILFRSKIGPGPWAILAILPWRTVGMKIREATGVRYCAHSWKAAVRRLSLTTSFDWETHTEYKSQQYYGITMGEVFREI